MAMFRIVALTLVLALSGPGAARAETLADALVSAYNHSGLLDQNRALLRAADEDVAQAVSQLRPIIGWAADLTREFGRTRTSTTFGARPISDTEATLSITGQLLLYDFGQSKFRIEAFHSCTTVPSICEWGRWRGKERP